MPSLVLGFFVHGFLSRFNLFSYGWKGIGQAAGYIAECIEADTPDTFQGIPGKPGRTGDGADNGFVEGVADFREGILNVGA